MPCQDYKDEQSVLNRPTRPTSLLFVRLISRVEVIRDGIPIRTAMAYAKTIPSASLQSLDRVEALVEVPYPSRCGSGADRV